MNLESRYVHPSTLEDGLRLLMRSSDGQQKDFYELYAERKSLERHPFNLDLPSDEASRYVHEKVVLVADPGSTQESVDNMVTYLQFALSSVGASVTRLREIKVGDGESHRILFEVWTRLGVYLCGGCTDCSGEGGSGTARMRSIFALLNLVYLVPHEVVSITTEQARQSQLPDGDKTGLRWYTY